MNRQTFMKITEEPRGAWVLGVVPHIMVASHITGGKRAKLCPHTVQKKFQMA